MANINDAHNSSYALNEPLETIIRERTILVEEIFNGCGWGVMFVLYWQSISILLKRRRDWFLGLHATALFIIGTTYLIGCMVLTEKTFIDNRNVPGGPSQAIIDVYSQPIVMLANASFPLQSWLADALIIYRCLVIFAYNYWVIVFPSILLLGSICTGATLLGFESHANVGFWSKISVNLAIPYFSLSISLNIIVTTLIVLRLLYHRKAILTALGTEHARHYISISAMLVESAALNTGCSLVFLVLYARGNPGANIFQGLVCYCQITASMLIVLRVVKGHAWSRGTAESTFPISGLEFNTPQPRTGTNKTSNMAHRSSSAGILTSGILNSRDIQIQLDTFDYTGSSGTTDRISNDRRSKASPTTSKESV